MPRLHQVPRAEAAAPIVTAMYDYVFGERDPVAEPGTESGSPGDWWTVFANVPDILEHAVQGFGIYRSPNRKLDPLLRELGQTRVGWAAQSQFVFSQHCKSLRALGVSEERIAAIAHWQAADCFTEVERLVLAYTDCLAFDHGRVPDGLFDKLHEHLSDEEILELTYITSLYFQHAVMSRALRTEFDDVPEAIVEVPAPEGTDPIDVGRYLSRNRGS
ncbi:MAG TPA: carboxymuconolactone decarboxylase family protein [Acidimicrobiales bacterium]